MGSKQAAPGHSEQRQGKVEWDTSRLHPAWVGAFGFVSFSPFRFLGGRRRHRQWVPERRGAHPGTEGKARLRERAWPRPSLAVLPLSLVPGPWCVQSTARSSAGAKRGEQAALRQRDAARRNKKGRACATRPEHLQPGRGLTDSNVMQLELRLHIKEQVPGDVVQRGDRGDRSEGKRNEPDNEVSAGAVLDQ